MRILYLAPNIPVPGAHGGSTHVSSVHRALKRRNDVLLVARRGSTEPGALAIGFGLAPVLQHLVVVWYLARIARAVRRFSPQVIYERYSAFGLGVALGRLLDVPSVLMTLDRDASPISFAGSARIVATSSSFIPPRWLAKYREVRWGVDVERFAGGSGDEVRAALAPRGEQLVMYTGSCAHWHGLDVLVEVASRWRGPPVRFVIVGAGEDLERVRRLAQRRGVLERMAFVGRVPHDAIASYLAAADVCVAPYAPSRHPIFREHGMDRDPIKVLEYMALAKPCVTIDTPRMRALFRADEEALLYRPEDADGLASAVSSLLADPERAARIGRAGAELVRRRHTWDQHAEALESIFAEAISERRAARSR
jgi:glycosyltransferase involved in cell wall biosynthesis